MSWILTALRLQRFEIGAAVLIVLVVSATALIVRWRLDAVGVRLECLTPWIYGLPDDPFACDARTRLFSDIRWGEAKHVMDAMAVVPYVIGVVLGAGLVGREIETGTASMAWSLAGSRVRWLFQRLLPILGLLLGLLAVLGIASWVLAAGMHPWLGGRPTFDLALYQGPDLIAVGLATFGVAVLVGAWSGRMLPVVVISALLALLLAFGSVLLLTSWQRAAAHEISVPAWFNGEYDGGRFLGGERYRLPDGGIVEGWIDVDALAPASADPDVWLAENVQKLAIGVVSADYPAWVATLAATFGGAGLALLGATFVIVDRRRPF